MNRAEHLQWCKDRALRYVDVGDCQNAVASILSDLRKHPETADHAGIELMVGLSLRGHLSRPKEIRDYIEGFN